MESYRKSVFSKKIPTAPLLKETFLNEKNELINSNKNICTKEEKKAIKLQNKLNASLAVNEDTVENILVAAMITGALEVLVGVPTVGVLLSTSMPWAFSILGVLLSIGLMLGSYVIYAEFKVHSRLEKKYYKLHDHVKENNIQSLSPESIKYYQEIQEITKSVLSFEELDNISKEYVQIAEEEYLQNLIELRKINTHKNRLTEVKPLDKNPNLVYQTGKELASKLTEEENELTTCNGAIRQKLQSINKVLVEKKVEEEKVEKLQKAALEATSYLEANGVKKQMTSFSLEALTTTEDILKKQILELQEMQKTTL